VEKPEVMVVIPTLGTRLASLERALASCESLTGLSDASIFVIVPKGALKARNLAARHGATVIDDPGTGMAMAINAALDARTSEKYYVWLGDDDLLVGAGVAKLVKALRGNLEAVVAHGQCEYISESGTTLAVNRLGRYAGFFLPWGPNFIPHPGTVVSLDALQGIGGFDPRLKYALDLDAFLKLRKMGRFVAVPAIASRFCWHTESLTVADRAASSREAMAVKVSHLPPCLRFMSPLWNLPVAWASARAARRLDVLASRQ